MNDTCDWYGLDQCGMCSYNRNNCTDCSVTGTCATSAAVSGTTVSSTEMGSTIGTVGDGAQLVQSDAKTAGSNIAGIALGVP
jgi:hypothetical protein